MATGPQATVVPVAIIGAGQSGLAVAWFLKRAGIDPLLLDAGAGPGGAWVHGWDSLRLFSPAEANTLPGWPMPPAADGGFPTRPEVIAYLAAYETRYGFDIRRPVTVTGVSRATDGAGLRLTGPGLNLRAGQVVAATGTWSAPVIPDIEGAGDFQGLMLHSAHYDRPDRFSGLDVLIIGGGNSGAQILADLSGVARCTWITEHPPHLLPDDLDGRALFQRARARAVALSRGDTPPAPLVGGLQSIVMVPPVRAARDRGRLVSAGPIRRLRPRGAELVDGRMVKADAVIWCTGFRPALACLAPLRLANAAGQIAVDGNRALDEPRLWLVGYGDWTGFASATLGGITPSARATAAGIAAACRLGAE
ncbi:monooxygenase [Tistrella bauzanensis]|uniref:Monooxygenase n=1 Tax=Tistrella bauzanensis TaxID=657419 RepID=A0ABQ1IS98_9PROT|nr:ArsO family NAD(P)H-dependent flavin-containing monooxygenase [Tistrella bauzanensis]GGB51228.1 monooxygenase [Tistrella bauzanensis]